MHNAHGQRKCVAEFRLTCFSMSKFMDAVKCNHVSVLCCVAHQVARATLSAVRHTDERIPRTLAYLGGGALDNAPLLPEHKNEQKWPIYQKNKRKFLRRRTAPCPDPARWEAGTPHGAFCAAPSVLKILHTPLLPKFMSADPVERLEMLYGSSDVVSSVDEPRMSCVNTTDAPSE